MHDMHYNSREEEKKNSIFAPNYINLKRAAYKASHVLFSLGWTNPSSVMMYHCVAPSALVRVPFPSTDCNMMVPPSPPMWTTMMPCHTSLPKPHCLLTLGTVPELSSWPRSHFNVKRIESTLDLDFKTPPFSFKVTRRCFSSRCYTKHVPNPHCCPTLPSGSLKHVFFFLRKANWTWGAEQQAGLPACNMEQIKVLSVQGKVFGGESMHAERMSALSQEHLHNMMAD